MIATIQILENGSYSPSRILQMGNKYDNLDNAYVVLRIPDRYLDYHFYIYAVNGKHKYTLPLNWITDEEGTTLRFYITNTLTQWAGTWQMALIASEGQLNNMGASLASLLNGSLTSEIFVSNVILGTVADNHITNPLSTDLEDNNLEIMYDDLRDLAQSIQDSWEQGQLDGPYYIPSVNLSGVLSWVGTKPDMPTPTPTNVRGPKGEQGEQPLLSGNVEIEVSLDEEATASMTGEGTQQIPYQLHLSLPKVGALELENAIESVLARMFIWDEEEQTLTINVNLIGE